MDKNNVLFNLVSRATIISIAFLGLGAKSHSASTVKIQNQTTRVMLPSPSRMMANGESYLPLTEIAKSLCLITISDTRKGQVTMAKGDVRIQFSSDQNCITYQQSKIFLAHKLIFQNQNLWVSHKDYQNILVPLLAINLIQEKPPQLKTIVIDPGHGGKDPGAINARLNIAEKDIVLQIAKQLRPELVKAGFSVIETRTTDTFITPKDRPLKAKNADFFLSIHANSSTDSSSHGVEVFTLKRAQGYTGNIADPWNLMAGYSILSTLAQSTKLENRGLKTDKFAVLKSASTPGILVEIGFINNDTEARKLADPIFQKQIVQGLVDGVKKYNTNLDKKRRLLATPQKGKYKTNLSKTS